MITSLYKGYARIVISVRLDNCLSQMKKPKIDEYLAVFTHECIDGVTKSSPAIKVI